MSGANAEGGRKMNITISKTNNLQQKQRYIKENARQLKGKVKLHELFNPSFMKAHTRLADVHEFFENSGFRIVTKADMRSIPDNIWNAYIASVSDFSTWREMLCTAVVEYIKNKAPHC